MRSIRRGLSTERPSSFPGIWKQPSYRAGPCLSALDWIKGKREDDDLHGLWRVHDKIYDLQTFVKHHPGGAEWLEISRGTDITEAFEVSHIANPKFAERTLKAYYVCNASSQRMSPYTFHETGFYKVLKDRAEPIIREIGSQPTQHVRWMMDFLFLCLMLMTLLATTMGFYKMQILTGLTLSMTCAGASNFLHLRESWRKYYFDWSWHSSFEYRISHFFSHHLFPNTIMDFEILSLEPLLEFLPKRDKTWMQCYGSIAYCHLIYATGFFLAFVIRWRRIFRSQQDFRPENLLVLIHLFICIIVAPCTISGFISWLIIHFSASYFFNLTILISGHHHPSIFHDGDEARTNSDFGLCQLDAVRNRSDAIIKKLTLFKLIGFGEHSLHHLFPTICISKLVHLKPILEKTLDEINEKYTAISQWDHFTGSLAQLRRTRRKGIAERNAE